MLEQEFTVEEEEQSMRRNWTVPCIKTVSWLYVTNSRTERCRLTSSIKATLTH